MHPLHSTTQSQSSPLVIGYYPFRGKVQICRLLCEYLHVSYVDQLFTPEEWSRFKASEGSNWVIKDLPFCKDGNFIVTGPSGIAHYILEKAGRADLLGNNLADRIKIDSIRSKHDLRNAIFGLVCSSRAELPHDDQKDLHFYWRNKIYPILKDYENECPISGWYYGYITVMDFLVYELVNLVESIFPNEVRIFNKLLALRQRFGCISEIREYQASERALRQFCPVRYFNKYKEQRIRKGHKSQEMHNTQMDVQS